MLDTMSEELYTYLNTVTSDSVRTGLEGGGGRDLVYKKSDVCVDGWWEPNTCIKSFGIVCQLLVGFVVPRGWLLRRWCLGVAWVSQWYAVVAMWSFRVE
jgi:hypothetical protein